jgi:hypothetical protein
MTPVVLKSALMEDYIDFNIRVWQQDNGYYTEQKYKRNMQQLQRFYSSYKCHVLSYIVMSCPCAFSSIHFPLLVLLGFFPSLYPSLSLSFCSCSQLFLILLTTSFTLVSASVLVGFLFAVRCVLVPSCRVLPYLQMLRVSRCLCQLRPAPTRRDLQSVAAYPAIPLYN